MRAFVPSLLAVSLYALTAAAIPTNLSAQDVEALGRAHGVRPPSSYYDVLARFPDAYRFSPEGVWKRVAQRVRERRQALARTGDWEGLNAHFRSGGASRSVAQATGAAVAGTFRIPVLIGYFSDSTQAYHPSQSELDSVLFSTIAAPPYSVSTFYGELSDGLATVTGDIIGWFKADSASTWYEGSSNGLNPSTSNTGDFIKELLDAADGGTDFSQYDWDSDGDVDLIAVLHPLKGGECGSSHIWSHRWVYRAWKGGAYNTNDGVTVDDYLIQPAVGGSSGCDSTAVMAIGTFSHELGHGFGLPDLYDTSGASEGIGEWGLMGSGSWNLQTSPAHMMSWSKDDLGWVTVAAIDSSTAGSMTLHPVISRDTAYRVNIASTSEYFLLENRAALGSDVNLHAEGLLIWHISPDTIAARRGSNTVNAVFPHGVDLEQADGADDLGNDVNRGDSGDPFPGSTSNTAFGPTTSPDSDLNDGSSSGLNVDSITVNPDKSIGFRVNFNAVQEVITTSVGAGTQVSVDGSYESAPHSVIWAYPSVHTISVDSIQGDTLTRYVWQSWSDAGARTHTVNIDATPDTFTANLNTEYRLRATSDVSGSVTSSVTLDLTGVAWLAPGSPAQLVAVPNSGFLFVQWSGDTTSIADTLNLTMAKPYTVHAQFGTAVAIDPSVLDDGVMGASYEDTLAASGGSGSFTWSLTGGDALPAGLTLDGATGVISGVPEEDGSFDLVVQATSGALMSEDTVPLTVTRPTLVLDDVVNQLLSPVNPLTADEERFLDLIGNNNGSFDIGDFRAYLQETGVVTDVVPAETSTADDETEGEASRREEG